MIRPFRWTSSPKRDARGLLASSHDIASADFLWLIGSIVRIAGIAFDGALLRSRHPGPYSAASVFEALKEFGLAAVPVTGKMRSRVVAGALPQLVAWTLSTAVETTDSPVSQEQTDARPKRTSIRPQLLIRKPDDSFSVFEPGSRETTATLSCDELEQKAMLEIWSFVPHAKTVENEDGGSGTPKRAFGFRTLIPELLKYRGIWRDVLLASLAIQVVGLGTPLLTQVIIDKVLVHQTISTLIVVGLSLVVFLIFSSGMSWVRQYLVLHTGNRIDAVLGSRVFSHLLHLPPRYFERRPTGTIIARLQGVETIREFITGAAITLILDLPFLLVFVAIMFYYSWELALVAMGFTAGIALLSIAVTPLLRKRLNDQFMRGARNQAFTTEYIAGFETIKTLQLEPTLQKRYGDMLADYLRSTFLARQLGNSFSTIANGAEQAMTLTILVGGALIVMRNDGFTIGMLVAFQMFASRMSQPLMRIVGLWQEFQQSSIAIKRLGDLMDAPAEPYSVMPSRASTQRPGQIEVHDVGFRFGPDQPWLFRNFSLTLHPGKTTVLTGASGTGKSTLTKLLLGFHQPQEGRIRLDDQDIAYLSANELRSAFGVVPQETLLFSGTIFENLQLAKPEASFEDIVECCRLAEIHDAIERMPQGYQTPLGEHGVGLSGGQRQRIAIARALLRQPRVLIFDEATSNLDSPTAEAFAHTVNELRGKATILFITHNLPKGLRVDQISRLPPSKSAQALIAAVPGAS